MTTLARTIGSVPRVPLAVFLLVALLVVGSRLTGMAGQTRPEVVPNAGASSVAAPSDLAASTAADELARIRANLIFWGDRFRANRGDFVSATRFAQSSVELARATGDVTAYTDAATAIEAALDLDASYAPARALRGAILVALHQFGAARDDALALLRDRPTDPSALATLGDASLELGDLDAAAGAYERLRLVDDGAATHIRVGRLAFIRGRTTEAVQALQTAAARAADDGVAGGELAWYRAQLGDLLLATGDRPAAAEAFADALAADATAPLALAGRARLAAAEGRLDDAIADLDRALAVIPLPELLARRADLYDLRAAAGDDRRAATDRATILAIADLAGDAAGVYDRTLSLYLATTGIDPDRAVRLAEEEIRIRTDVYGYDALGWALLAAGRPVDADAALRQALAVGTRDARLLYHAGMAAAAVADPARARSLLSDALALDPTFDPVGVTRARATLEALP